jgi:hypothetical protein
MGNEKAAAKIHEQSRFSGNMWLKRTGWAKHLRAFDREWLYNTTREPDGESDGEPDGERVNGKDTEEERSGKEALEWIWLAIDRLIWQTQRASHSEEVGSAAVNYIKRREAGGYSDIKPFYAD